MQYVFCSQTGKRDMEKRIEEEIKENAQRKNLRYKTELRMELRFQKSIAIRFTDEKHIFFVEIRSLSKVNKVHPYYLLTQPIFLFLFFFIYNNIILILNK